MWAQIDLLCMPEMAAAVGSATAPNSGYGLWAEDLAVTEYEPHPLRSAGAVPPTCAVGEPGGDRSAVAFW
jgi:hypothetical protein